MGAIHQVGPVLAVCEVAAFGVRQNALALVMR
jgi:hypothetical protein